MLRDFSAAFLCLKGRCVAAGAPYIDLPLHNLLGTIIVGWISSRTNPTDRNVLGLETAVETYLKSGAGLIATFFLSLLIDEFRLAGDYDSCFDYLERAFDLVDTQSERFWLPELLRIRGDLHIQSSKNSGESVDVETVTNFFDESEKVAAHQQAHSLLLRTSLSRGRFLLDCGLRDEARAGVAGALRGITGGERGTWLWLNHSSMKIVLRIGMSGKCPTTTFVNVPRSASRAFAVVPSFMNCRIKYGKYPISSLLS